MTTSTNLSAERRDWTIEQYHADRTALSNTSLKMALTTDGLRWRFTPTRYRLWRDGKMPNERNEAFEFGIAVHAAMEGSLDAYVRIGPEASRNSTEWKGWAKRQVAEIGPVAAARCVFQKPSEWSVTMAVYQAIQSHPLVSDILAESPVAVEGSIIFDAFGRKIKGRPDLETTRKIVDWKTAADPFDWLPKVYDLGYHRQAAIMQRAVMELAGEVKPVQFVVVGKSFPYDVCVYELPERDLELGWAEVQQIVERISGWEEFDFPAQPWEREVCRTGLSEYYHAAKTIADNT